MAQFSVIGLLLDTTPNPPYTPGSNLVITADNTPGIYGTANANSTVQLAFSRQGLGGAYSADFSTSVLADASGNWTYTSSVIPDGSWSITAKDQSGAADSKYFFVDTTPPTARIIWETLNVASNDLTFDVRFYDNSDARSFYSGAAITYTRPEISAGNFVINEKGVSGSYIKSIVPEYSFPDYGYKVTLHVGAGAGSVSVTLDADKAPLTDKVGNALVNDATSKEIMVGAEAVFRFYDTSTGNHFYTTSSNEKTQIDANLSSFKFEGVQWGAPVDGIDVFRFFDTVTKDHFFTTSTNERDAIMSQSSHQYVYEGVAFHAYDNMQPGAVVLERFYNKITGVHHFSANADETLSIMSGAQGLGWVDEGKAFAVNPPTHDLLIL